MAVYIGRRGSVGIGIETTPGSTTALTHFIPWLEFGLQENHEPIPDSQARGVRDSQGSGSVEGKKTGEGDLKVILDASYSPYLFGLALGDIDSIASDDVYVHTITRKTDSVPRTATIWKDRMIDEVVFTYSAVNTLNLTFSDDVAELTASVISKYPVSGWTETPSITTTELYTFKNAYIELTDVDSATSELKVTNFSLDINNNLEAVFSPGDNVVERIVSKNFEVNGSLTVLFENTTQISAYNNLDKQALSIVFEGDDTGKITINIPQFRLQSAPVQSPLDDIMSQEAEFVAEYDGSKTISIEVENEVENYYS